ncbi:MAG TPA: hypothetical protein VJH68_02315 [Candidatus Nanoarchaeia archaeon]|nr:hypothetical protein [Candidatus Nanoarchaeia archaeon]
MKPPHLAINDEVSKEAVSQLRIFSIGLPVFQYTSDINVSKLRHVSEHNIQYEPHR